MHDIALDESRTREFWWQGALMSIKARSADTGGAFGLVEAHFPEGFGPPLHVHSREDEGFYILEGRVRFRQGAEDFVAGPGTFVWGPAAFRTRSRSSPAEHGR